MKPAPFAYADPDTLDGVLDLLADGRDAAVIAGGQSLVPLLNLRLARPDLVIDPRRVDGLGDIEWRDDSIRVGALTTAASIAADHALANALPGLIEAVRCIGHPPIRTRTTIGGSIAHADPVAELPTVLVGLDATVELASRDRGVRQVPAASFFLGPFTTAREPDELVVAVELPRRPGWTGWIEHARRPGDFALVGIFAAVTFDEHTVASAVTDQPVADRSSGGPAPAVSSARVAIGGLAGAPMLVDGAAEALVGRPVDGTAGARVSALVAAIEPPPDDLHGSGAYRVALATELTHRLLRRAAS